MQSNVEPVWKHVLLSEFGIFDRGSLSSELQPFRNANACQWPAGSTGKERQLRRARPGFEPAFELCGGVGPQGNRSILAALCSFVKNVAPSHLSKVQGDICRAERHIALPTGPAGKTSDRYPRAIVFGVEFPVLRNERALLPWFRDPFPHRCWSCQSRRDPATPGSC